MELLANLTTLNLVITDFVLSRVHCKVNSTKCLLTPPPHAPVMVRRRECLLRCSLEANFSVTREDEAPVSSAALTKLSLGPWMALVITVGKKEPRGSDCWSAVGAELFVWSTAMRLGADVVGDEVEDVLAGERCRRVLCFPLHSLYVKVDVHSETV